LIRWNFLILAYPTAPSHSIEPLAEQFGLKAGQPRWNEVLALDESLVSHEG